MHTYEDWETGEELPLPKLTPEARAAVTLLKECDEYGPLHIIVADGNVADEHLDMCEREPIGRDLFDQERDLLTALRALPYAQREAAWSLAAYGLENV